MTTNTDITTAWARLAEALTYECKECGGSGKSYNAVQPVGYEVLECPACKGAGKVWPLMEECESCKVYGLRDYCVLCHGTGCVPIAPDLAALMAGAERAGIWIRPVLTKDEQHKWFAERWGQVPDPLAICAYDPTDVVSILSAAIAAVSQVVQP